MHKRNYRYTYICIIIIKYAYCMSRSGINKTIKQSAERIY